MAAVEHCGSDANPFATVECIVLAPDIQPCHLSALCMVNSRCILKGCWPEMHASLLLIRGGKATVLNGKHKSLHHNHDAETGMNDKSYLP